MLGSLLLGMVLAILIDQRVRGESVWRSMLLYPLALSFVVTGTVWRWIFNPTTGLEAFAHDMGWLGFKFDWILDRTMAIYTIVITGTWHASGFAMVLILAGLRSVDPDLIKAAQIDGASMARIYRRIVLPAIRPIIVSVVVILLQFAIKTFDLVAAQTGGGPGLATNVPAIYVYDLMFQRGQIAQGAAAAVMILVALALVLAPYAIWIEPARAPGGGPCLTATSRSTRSPAAARGSAADAMAVVYVLLALFCVYYLLPLTVIVFNSFRDLKEIARGGLIGLPHSFSTDHWVRAWSTHCVNGLCKGISPYFFNSLWMAVPATDHLHRDRRGERLRALVLEVPRLGGPFRLHHARRLPARTDGAAALGLHAWQRWACPTPSGV